ncbi:MAG: hypothetical protein ABIN13_02185, partial [Mucilaginibacter sp.]
MLRLDSAINGAFWVYSKIFELNGPVIEQGAGAMGNLPQFPAIGVYGRCKSSIPASGKQRIGLINLAC